MEALVDGLVDMGFFKAEVFADVFGIITRPCNFGGQDDFVSMENKLLFRSGSWTVGAEGRLAIEELGNVLADNPDISILIEGHTDNVPYSGKGPLKGNWDLSTKRATAIVNQLLENPDILPQNLTAAGRGEYLPIAPNSTRQGRAANRRIEVVLSPQLDEIKQIINTID